MEVVETTTTAEPCAPAAVANTTGVVLSIIRRFGSRDDGGLAEYRLSWCLLLLSSVGAFIILKASGMVVLLSTMIPIVICVSVLIAFHVFYGIFRPIERLSLVTGTIGMMIASALAAGIIAHAGMRLRMPLIDGVLADSDAALGIDTRRLVLAFAEHPYFSKLLQIAYVSVFPLSFLAAGWLSLTRQAKRVWELVFGFCSGIEICSIISVYLPALANFQHAGLSRTAIEGLPEGSGVFFLSTMHYFRDGHDPTLDIKNFAGVVTFPSFHTIMAIIIAFAFRGSGLMSWMVFGWCALIIVGTVPIGGHYVVDLIGGAVLWMLCLMLARCCSPVDAPRPTADRQVELQDVF